MSCSFYLIVIKLNCLFFIPEARQIFDDLCVKHNVDCSAPRTTTRLLDKVCMSFSCADLDQFAAFYRNCFCGINITMMTYFFSGQAQPSCP